MNIQEMGAMRTNHFDPRNISFKRDKVIEGVNILGDAVGSTLGALGHTVFIQDDYGNPVITKDGYNVSVQVNVEDPEAQLAIQVVRQATKRTADYAGDGTTTSTVLTQAIINNAYKSEYPAAKVVKGIKDATRDVLEVLEADKKDMSGDIVKHIATVSVNNDEKLGEIVADVFDKCGDFGGVDFKVDPNSTEVTTEFTTGSMLPLGYGKKAMINNPELQAVIMKDPLVLITAAEIPTIKSIAAITEYAVEQERSLLIIGNTSDDVDETLIANVQQGYLKGAAVAKTNQFTNRNMLKSVAKMIGATYFDEYSGNSLEIITPEHLGSMTEVNIKDTHTVFVVKDAVDMTEEKKSLKKRIDNETLPGKKQDLEEELAAISSAFGVIKIGAPTDAERKEIFHRVEDAVKAIGTAKQFGYLPGGGVKLRDVSKTLKKPVTDGYSFGYNALIEALSAPYYKILSNGGINTTKSWLFGLFKKEEALKDGFGYNVMTGEVVDVEKAGIIDPAGVTMQALANASSAAVTILSTKTIITNKQ